ncbi:unnamed protein product [Pleuronectes platessa]|uniref:Uncharacterized protein n=1 Tax=Pleuronectes platessa TaxID=8262 RepID=A0A9N7Z6G5_PLEPL|nr:unnamed protein product [Pleuronectes platessa]
MRVPYTGSRSDGAGVHEHDRSETTGRDRGKRSRWTATKHNPRNETSCCALLRSSSISHQAQKPGIQKLKTLPISREGDCCDCPLKTAC